MLFRSQLVFVLGSLTPGAKWTTLERGPGNGPICIKRRMVDVFDSQGMHGWWLWDGEGGEREF